MRSLRFAIVAASLLASAAFASPTAPSNGVEYITLANPQPVQPNGKKVEVLEFFMYQCPHCHVLDPHLIAWIKKQGDNISFKRIHYPVTGPNDAQAHMYLTLEAMGKVDEMHEKVFKAFHVDRLRLNTNEAMMDWAGKNGLDKVKFLEYWNSFGVLSKMKRLPTIMQNYKVDSAPTLVVEGRYMTSPSVVGAVNKGASETELSRMTVQVLDALVAKVQKDGGIKPVAAK
jgi:thiol:disulfide interchange protein DsbA